jgi:hypothetical protein
MKVTSKEAEAFVGWLVREKTLKGFGWLVGWEDRGEGDKDAVARKGEEVTGKGGEGSWLPSHVGSPVYPVSFHRVLCVFWMVLWVEILGSRSTLPSPFLHNRHLTSGFAGLLRAHRHSSCSPPLPTRRSVQCTRKGSSWYVWTTSPPTASPHHGLRHTWAAPTSPTDKRPSSGHTWLSHATRGGSHSPPLPSPHSGLCCWLFSSFYVVVMFCFGLFYCNLSLFIHVSVFEFFKLFIHLLPP